MPPPVVYRPITTLSLIDEQGVAAHCSVIHPGYIEGVIIPFLKENPKRRVVEHTHGVPGRFIWWITVETNALGLNLYDLNRHYIVRTNRRFPWPILFS